MSDRAELRLLTRALAVELGRRKRHGLRHVSALEPGAPEPPAARTKAATAPAPRPRTSAPLPAAPKPPAPKPSVPKPTRLRAPAQPGDLEALRRLIGHCMDCGLSAGPRGSGALVGRGAARPRLLFVTDYAGPAERSYGKVLAPEAGTMIANMVTRGFGLELSEVYVTAAVKCPLGQGCQPSPKEQRACSRHLATELELLAPGAIVAFGALAASALGQPSEAGIGPLRGRLLPYKEHTPMVVTAHPRDMLADPSLKPAVWADLQLLLPHLAKG